MFEDFTIEPDGEALLVSVGGAAQSRVVPDDPYELSWGYLRHIAAAVDARRPDALDIVHVGGGGMVLARYFAHAHPGSRQIVVEPNRPMTDAVLEQVPFPAGANLALRPEFGRPVINGLEPQSADLIVVDAYAAGHVPEDLTTSECVAAVNRVLRDDGILAYGLIDHPDMHYVARVCATIRAAAPLRLTVLSPHHQYFGNHTVLGTRGDALTEEVLSAVSAADAGYIRRTANELDALCAAAVILTDASPAPSPDPPAETLGASW